MDAVDLRMLITEMMMDATDFVTLFDCGVFAVGRRRTKSSWKELSSMTCTPLTWTKVAGFL